jgi:two-component flavin-dependent monooxygenase
LSEEVVRGVLAAGFARHFVPARWGGTEGGFGSLARATAVLGRACPSTAWLASLCATLGRMCGYLAEDGQRAVWSKGPDTVIAGSLLPLGTAAPDPGGWRVDGTWPYVSGAEFADWALVLARTTAEPVHARFFMVPRTAFRVVPTWSVVGMRATGSHTVVVQEHVVAPELSYARTDLDAATASPGHQWFHGRPLEGISGLTFVAPLLGAAQGAISCWAAHIADRVAQGNPRMSIMGGGHYEQVLTRSAAEVDAAALLIERSAERADSGGLTDRQVAEGARDCAYAAELAVAAVDRLIGAAGTAAMAEDHPLQRYWRDLHCGAGHIMLQLPRSAAGFARASLDSLADPELAFGWPHSRSSP